MLDERGKDIVCCRLQVAGVDMDFAQLHMTTSRASIAKRWGQVGARASVCEVAAQDGARTAEV